MTAETDEDNFRLGFGNGHDEAQLKAMSYIALCAALEDAKLGTMRYMLLESEKRKRDALDIAEPAQPEPNHTTDKSANPKNDPGPNEPHWWKRPLGLIFIGVSIPVLTVIALYLLNAYFGITK